MEDAFPEVLGAHQLGFPPNNARTFGKSGCSFEKNREPKRFSFISNGKNLYGRRRSLHFFLNFVYICLSSLSGNQKTCVDMHVTYSLHENIVGLWKAFTSRGAYRLGSSGTAFFFMKQDLYVFSNGSDSSL